MIQVVSTGHALAAGLVPLVADMVADMRNESCGRKKLIDQGIQIRILIRVHSNMELRQVWNCMRWDF